MKRIRTAQILAILICVTAWCGNDASAQSPTGTSLLTSSRRDGGQITNGASRTWSWSVPPGRYYAIAHVFYRFVTSNSEDATMRCELRSSSDPAIDYGLASTPRLPQNGSISRGELTLVGLINLDSQGVVAINCSSPNQAPTEALLESVRLDLLPISSVQYLTQLPNADARAR